jgi:hypothetical protein
MIRAANARHPSLEDRLQLAGIQVTPSALRSMVMNWQFLGALGAAPATSFRMIHLYLNPIPSQIQMNFRYSPRS